MYTLEKCKKEIVGCISVARAVGYDLVQTEIFTNRGVRFFKDLKFKYLGNLYGVTKKKLQAQKLKF